MMDNGDEHRSDERASSPRSEIIDDDASGFSTELKDDVKDSGGTGVFEEPVEEAPVASRQLEEETFEDSGGVVVDGDEDVRMGRGRPVDLDVVDSEGAEQSGHVVQDSMPDEIRGGEEGEVVMDVRKGGEVEDVAMSDENSDPINGLDATGKDTSITEVVDDDFDGEKIPSATVSELEKKEDDGQDLDVLGAENGHTGNVCRAENGHTSRVVDSKIDSNGKLSPPPNDYFAENGQERAENENMFSSVVSFEREDEIKPVAAVPEVDEGDSDHVSSVEQSEEDKKKDEKDRAEQDLKYRSDQPFQEELVTVEDASGLSSSDEDDGNSSTLAAPAVDSSSRNSVNSSSQSQPAGLGSSVPLLETTARSVQQPRVNGAPPQRQPQLSEDVVNGDAEEYDETREKLQMIRVRFLRLARRLGQTPHNVVVAQVLYRLGLAEQLRGSNTGRLGAFSFDRASAMAEQQEATGLDPLNFSCTIMVIGKTGVGKSASINSIFDETKFKTDAFHSGTTKVQDIVGKVQGIQLRVIDTPGLSPSSTDQPKNEKILNSVKHFIKKTPPDVIMYLDRLDMQSRDHGDVPLLRTITKVFGPSIWFNAIVVLTHAASAPPDGPNGTPLSYEMYVTQRSHVIQQAVRQAAGDPRLLNPVSLVENHSACRMNRAGQRVLPNGQVWKPHLLLLSFASKILTEANTLLKLQDNQADMHFAGRPRAPPLLFLLSSLLQSRAQVKLPQDQFGDDDSFDVESDEESDSGDEYDYDELPQFKCLTREQLSELSKSQRKAYYDELDYREKLFQRKQMKEEKKHRKILKKMAEAAKDHPNDHKTDNIGEDDGGPASVPVPNDAALPASFDSDNPSHRYRYLDSPAQWLVRPVQEIQGWDHDVGYEGLNVEKLFVVKDKIPISVSGQLTKDKKECSFQMEMAGSIKHGEGKATSLGMDMQTVGKDMAYTLRGETQFNNFRRNCTSTGVSATLLGDTVSAGLKIEDKLLINKRLKLLVAGGAMTHGGDVAYGGRLEATLRDKDYPLGRALSTLALSVVDWHGDLSIGCNLQSQVPVGRHTSVTGQVNMSNRGTGQVGIRVSSSEQLQLALIALVPIYRHVKTLFLGSSEFM